MPEPQRALTVTEAMTLAKRALEDLTLRVVGEVTEFSDKPGYKAVYFTIGDGSSVLPCLIWRDAYLASGVELRCGMLVELIGQLTAYPPKGRLQFQVRSLAAAGEGLLRMQVAALARKLESEGLMREERKRPLPSFPRRVGLVTSPRGKAIHDVIRTLRRRYPTAELVIAGVAVEGADAPAEIVRGLRAVADEPGIDVVILGRGGGSYEDLMPFNAEEVARAVAAMPMPVVTGIGHEPDTTIADMVADLRASTPTAAAEAVAPSQAEIRARFDALGRLLARGLLHAAQVSARRLAVASSSVVFRDPTTLFATPAQRLDTAAAALARALPARLEWDRERARAARAALLRIGPRMLERARDRAGITAARVEDLSPLGILARGYAVCYAEDGRRVVRAATDLSVGDRVRVRLNEGAAGCRVETVEALAGKDG